MHRTGPAVKSLSVEGGSAPGPAVECLSVMQRGAIYIEDEIHCEQRGPFESFEAAIAELRRRAEIAWDAPPNQAPCGSWRTCGRKYGVLEYDTRSKPWRLRRTTHVLDISAKGVKWVEGFEQAWAASAE
jgi:hypothetical protein